MRKIFTCMMLVLGSILSLARAADVLPEEGKMYYIKSDNVNTSKEDEDYYLYSNNGVLALSVNKGGSAYEWTCEKDGEYFRFKNGAGKYLAFTNAAGDRKNIALRDNNCNFTIDPTQKVNDGCLPLYSVAAGRYMLVKNGGIYFNQASGAYNKKTTQYSSDYIFEEVDISAKQLTIATSPAGVAAEFSWNGTTIEGGGSFELPGGSTVASATLSARITDPVSIYTFAGFYDGDNYLGETVSINELTADRTITAKFNMNIFSQNYGEKWIRVTANAYAGFMLNLPVKANYLNAAPNTATSNLSSENQLWCFVGNEEGFKIYNHAAGNTLALATASTSYGDGTVTKMVAAENATEWHLADKMTSNVIGLNISPKGNNEYGLNPYAGTGNDVKLYYNGNKGNMWGFQMAGNDRLNFRVEIEGTPKALNTKVGQISLNIGSITSTLDVTSTQNAEQNIYLAQNTLLNFKLGGTQYRGYTFKGFRIGNGELQKEITDLSFNETTTDITAVYAVDENDPNQYLFYSPGYQGHPYRIPAITTLKNGNILAVADFRWCGADIGFGHIDLVGRISKDNGKTWGNEFIVADGSGKSGANDVGYGDAAIVTDRESGKVLIMCCTGNVFYTNGTHENPLRSARLYSDNNGETWTTPEDITEQMYNLLPDSKGQFIGAGKICQSRVTKVGDYYRLYAALCTRPGGNYVIYSDDFGKTWAVLGGNASSCAPSGDEPKCEELPDGSVVLSSRKYSGRYFNIYKYTDVTTAAGSWLGVVSSNDTNGGLKFNSNSTNGEIQLVKVIKKEDNSFHYMMIQSVPYGPLNSGDEARSNVSIFYKVFDDKTMSSSTEIATGWNLGLTFAHNKGAYSTMCIQPDKNLGFFYEEGPNNYCMVYRPVSIEQLTSDAYTMYDPALHGIEKDPELATVKELFTTTLTKAKEYVIGSTTGTYTDADGSFTTALQSAEAAQEGIDQMSADEIRPLADNLNVAMNRLALNMPEAGKYYRFKGTTGAYLSATEADQTTNKPGRMMMTATADENTVFYLTADNRLVTPKGIGVFEYLIERYNTGLGSVYTFEDAGNAQYYIVTDNATYSSKGRGSWYATAAGQPVDRYCGAYQGQAPCAWTIEEVTEEAQQPVMTRTIATEGYATLAAPVALNIPQGVKAYTVTVNNEDNTRAILEEVTGVIPAGTAVVLKNTGETGSFNFTFAPEGSTDNENSLTGVYVDTTIPTATNAYILAQGTNGTGFYQMNADDRTLAAHKAYLALPAEVNAVRSIIFSDGTTTGIENTVAAGAENEEFYDLQGRRVMNPTKGIYVTKSGKKVVFRK